MKKTWVVAFAAVLAVGAGIYFWADSDSGYSAGTLASEPSGPMPQLPVEKSQADSFKDMSVLKPPAGAKVAIFEFDDLECPFCAHAVPLVRAAALQYKVPLIHHDYPLTEIHTWSFEAAVTARYLQDKVSPQTGDKFRGDVFAHQNEISSKDDLDRFTKEWFAANKQVMPFAIDQSGDCRKEVQADRALGDRMGIHSTPCIFVVTQQKWTYVTDLTQLPHSIEAALAETPKG